MNKLAAATASALILLGYAALMRADPVMYGWFRPRSGMGGMFWVAVFLALANAGVWMAADAEQPLNFRFQVAAAGWFWIVVQAFLVAWLYSQTGGG